MDSKILCRRTTEGWALSLDRKGETSHVGCFLSFFGIMDPKVLCEVTTEGWPLSPNNRGEIFWYWCWYIWYFSYNGHFHQGYVLAYPCLYFALVLRGKIYAELIDRQTLCETYF